MERETNDPSPCGAAPLDCDAWSERAVAYAELLARWPLFGILAQRLVDALGALACEHVLDLGAGTGLVTALILEQRPDARVTPADPSAAMRAQLAARFGARVEAPLAARAEDLDVAPSTFDAVLSSAAFHLADEARALPRIARALRPGGLFACNFWWHAWEETARELANDLGRAALTDAMAELGEGALALPAGTEPRLRSEAGLRVQAHSAGLELERVHVDRDPLPRRFFVDFRAMSPGLLAELDAARRSAVLERARALADALDAAHGVPLVPTARLVFRRAKAPATPQG